MFNPDDFAIDYNESNCVAEICAISNGLNLSGHLAADYCCGTDPALVSIPNARNIEFGRGITVTEYNPGEEGECCEPGDAGWVKIDVCTPKISGASCPDGEGAKTSIPCTGFECMVFNPDDFAIDYDEEDCSATICAISNGLNLSGHLAVGYCCETDPALVGIPNARNIEFGRGLTITDYNPGEEGECCEPGDAGWIKIDVCTPKISGSACVEGAEEWKEGEYYGPGPGEIKAAVGVDGITYIAITYTQAEPTSYPPDWERAAIDCTPYECLEFDERYFCIETGDCNARVYWAGMDISGVSGDCCESEEEEIGLTNIKNIVFGSGLKISDHYAGSCCDDGYVEVIACTPKISGKGCAEYEGGDRPDVPCTGFECISFNPADFAVDYNEDDCSATICATNNGISVSGYEVGSVCCSGELKGWSGIRTIDFGSGILVSNVSESSSDCCSEDPGGHLTVDVCQLNITGSFCDSSENFITKDCVDGETTYSVDITKEMIEDCLDTCCLEYLDHLGEPQTLRVFVPDCVTDCYGCCE